MKRTRTDSFDATKHHKRFKIDLQQNIDDFYNKIYVHTMSTISDTHPHVYMRNNHELQQKIIKVFDAIKCNTVKTLEDILSIQVESSIDLLLRGEEENSIILNNETIEEVRNQQLFKITNITENHHGYQYHDGLNILVDEFVDDPHQVCIKGGFYFSNARTVDRYFDTGHNVRLVSLPFDDPNLKVMRNGDTWRTNMLILGEKLSLSDAKSYARLQELGIDVSSGSYVTKFLSYCPFIGEMLIYPVLTDEIQKAIIDKLTSEKTQCLY